MRELPDSMRELPEHPLEMPSIQDSADDTLASLEREISTELQLASATALHKLTARMVADGRGGQRILHLIQELAAVAMNSNRVFRRGSEADEDEDEGDVGPFQRNIMGYPRRPERRLRRDIRVPIPRDAERDVEEDADERVLALLEGLSTTTPPERRAVVQTLIAVVVGDDRAASLVQAVCGPAAPETPEQPEQPKRPTVSVGAVNIVDRGQIMPSEMSRLLDEATLPDHMRTR